MVVEINGESDFVEIIEQASSPGTPVAGRVRIYSNTDKTLHQIDSTGLDQSLVNVGSATKDVFFQADTANNFGDYRSRNVGSAGSFRFVFFVPQDFTSIIQLAAICVPSVGASGSGKSIDLFSDYGALSESSNNHDESNIANVVDLTGKAGIITAIDVSSVFTLLSAGDFAGVLIDHKSIGGAIDYLGIRLRYS